MVAEFQSLAAFQEITGGDTPVIVDFYADWCGPCKVISPIFEKLSEQEGYQGIKFYKVDVDAQEDIARECSVRAMPTFILFHNGAKVDELVGAVPAKLQELVQRAISLN